MERRAISVALLLGLASLSLACSKDNKGEGDAAADAAPATVVAEAAAPEDAGAVVDASDGAAAPLATTVVRPAQKAPPPDPPICVSARAAKARNSPATAGLEAQCKAAGGKL